MKIAIIVLNWNGKEYISKSLDMLKKLDTSDYQVEVVVVDNNSTDGSVKLIKTQYPKFHLIENRENLGYAGGNNVGIRFALENGAEWIWIVNPDVLVDPQALNELLKVATKYPRAGVLGPKIYFAPGYEFEKERYKKSELGKVLWFAGGRIDWDNVIAQHLGVNEVDHGQLDRLSQTDFVTGAALLLNAQMLKEIGLLDPKYFLYYEENDLCQRAVKNNWELWYVPTSVVWHANAQATTAGSTKVDYYTTRNRLLFGLRWSASWRTKFALIRESVKLFFHGRPGQIKGVGDFYLNRFGEGLNVD